MFLKIIFVSKIIFKVAYTKCSKWSKKIILTMITVSISIL